LEIQESVSPILYAIYLNFDNYSCPSTLGGGDSGEYLALWNQTTDKTDSLIDVLNNSIDGGSTGLLRTEVENSTPNDAFQTMNNLIAKAPFLSDTIIKTSIVKEDVLDNAMIRDILVANSQSSKSDEIINMLANRIVPMPDTLMDQILLGEDTVSAKEILESQANYWYGESSKAYHQLIKNYMGYSLNPIKEDSLVWLLQSKNTPESFYNLAEFYQHKGIYDLSSNVLNMIPITLNLSQSEQSNHQSYLNFFGIYQQIKSDTEEVYNVSYNQLNDLLDVMSSNQNTPGAYSRNLLIAAGKLTYKEPVILPDTNLKSRKQNRFRGGQSKQELSYLKIYPNPASNYIIIDYKGLSDGKQVKINLFNDMGNSIYTKTVNCIENQLILTLQNYSPGLYFITLEQSGNTLKKGKFTIAR
jgi:hypothetical protein